ncbi:nuclear pore complex protein Nup155-like, partial [Limulus polyphemus]|uniref:Nuclear pore complex protein Nup155-like n=1 Tax=Limulus polyphemus TaxID=6850 RepID=A0ABM1TG76_LIMPO
MHLLPEPLYTLPTDNTLIQTIAGADNGRIFLGGKDGCLHELVYQAEDGWFRRKCKKVNHSSSSLSFLVPSFLNFAFSEEDPIVQIEIDNSRHVLYTRSDRGTIQVFDLGADGKQMTKVIAVSQNSIVQQAVNIAKTIDRSNFRPVVHISALDIVESVHINLVAVTQSGVRFYFTATALIHPEARPFTLSLLHVRLPPGFSANAPLQRPSHVHMAHYRKGCALLASSQTEDSDVMWAMSNDSFPFQSQLMELHTVIPVDGKTWCMTEVLQFQPPKPLCTLNINNVILPSEPPLVVSQHAELPRKFVVLSAQ